MRKLAKVKVYLVLFISLTGSISVRGEVFWGTVDYYYDWLKIFHLGDLVIGSKPDIGTFKKGKILYQGLSKGYKMLARHFIPQSKQTEQQEDDQQVNYASYLFEEDPQEAMTHLYNSGIVFATKFAENSLTQMAEDAYASLLALQKGKMGEEVEKVRRATVVSVDRGMVKSALGLVKKAHRGYKLLVVVGSIYRNINIVTNILLQ